MDITNQNKTVLYFNDNDRLNGPYDSRNQVFTARVIDRKIFDHLTYTALVPLTYTIYLIIVMAHGLAFRQREI